MTNIAYDKMMVKVTAWLHFDANKKHCCDNGMIVMAMSTYLSATVNIQVLQSWAVSTNLRWDYVIPVMTLLLWWGWGNFWRGVSCLIWHVTSASPWSERLEQETTDNFFTWLGFFIKWMPQKIMKINYIYPPLNFQNPQHHNIWERKSTYHPPSPFSAKSCEKAT